MRPTVRNIVDMFDEPSPDRVVVEGIVRSDASRSSRGWIAYLGPWWTHATARLNEVPLRVRMRELDETARAHLVPGATVKLTCTNLEHPRTAARWFGALAVPSSVRRTMAQPAPVLLSDRMFHTLVLDRRANAFVGRRRGSSGRALYALRIERTASVDDRDADRPEVERSRAAVRTCESAMARIHDEVAHEVQNLYHQRLCGRPMLSHAQVAGRIRLATLTVRRTSCVELSFSDDDLFFGSSITASLRRNLQLRRVEVEA